ncbi:LacI family DNA-binding transcriptional regulator [Leuconostoc falkenbergense]
MNYRHSTFYIINEVVKNDYIKEIALKAGYSSATVSRILNNDLFQLLIVPEKP